MYIRKYCQRQSQAWYDRVTDPQQLEVGVVMVEVIILGDVVAKVMVVTSSVVVADKFELLQCSPVAAMDRTVTEPIVMLTSGGQRQGNPMMLSQVLFWSVIAWLLYCLILDPHFLMYLPR